jgi:small subunit ribosomal protein S21
MIIIDVNKEKNLEVALKTLKNKVQKTKLVQRLKDRKEYVKPSVAKRKVKLKAIYIQQIKNGLN